MPLDYELLRTAITPLSMMSSTLLGDVKYNYINNKGNAYLGKTTPELSKSSQAADQFGSLIFRSIHKHAIANKNISYLQYIPER